MKDTKRFFEEEEFYGEEFEDCREVSEHAAMLLRTDVSKLEDEDEEENPTDRRFSNIENGIEPIFRIEESKDAGFYALFSDDGEYVVYIPWIATKVIYQKKGE